MLDKIIAAAIIGLILLGAGLWAWSMVRVGKQADHNTPPVKRKDGTNDGKET